MTTESHSSTVNATDTADVGSTAAEPVTEPSAEMPPIVQAELVRLPRPRPAAPSREDADSASQVRAARRRELLGIFFIHTHGALRAKRERAYVLLQRVVDPVERDRLHSLLGNLWNAAQSAPPPEGM